MLNLAKSTDGTPPVVHEVGLRLRKHVSHAGYRQLIAYAGQMGLSVHGWRGEDREGHPIGISWVATDSGALLAAYEIQEA
jgi:hypothetical protein